MPTITTSGRIIAARLATVTALDRAVHLPAADRAQLHLRLLNVSSAASEHRLTEAEAVAAFEAIRERLAPAV